MVGRSVDLWETRTSVVAAAGSLLLTACTSFLPFSSSRAPTPAPPMGAVSGTLRFVEGSTADTAAAPLVLILEPLERAPEQRRPTQLVQLASSTDRFEPGFVAIAQGDYIVFANGGSISHRFFSAHLGSDVQIPVSPGGTSDPVRIDEKGQVRFFCSLHSDESFSILVTSAVYSGVVRPDGTYYIGPVPDGTYRLSVWSRGHEGSIKTLQIDGGHSIVEALVIDPSLISR